MKKILLTGGTSGIGLAILKKLANNYEIIFTYNTNELLAKKLVQEMPNTSTFKLDLSNKKSIEELVNHIKDVDILINNAAISTDNDLNLKSYDEFKNVINVNLVGTYYLTKLISKEMLTNKSGNIIFVSSTNAIDSNYIESIDYDASKSGINSLMNNFADALAPNIRVNAIAPGWVNTKMNATLTTDFKAKELDKILLNRFAEPIEIANLVEFLISDNASYINKTVIKIDGGRK